ncbi:MAG: hypothetical protein ACR2PX_22210 [Endozoicomonas sp.]|uniref:hypothetical protein n=1 Tax=Endozoicomonas sp. TaxID=1892382 RepID=UPI003D9B4735
MDRSDSTSSTGSTISTQSMPEIKVEDSDTEENTPKPEGHFKHRRTHSATPNLENIKEESLSQSGSMPGTPDALKKKLPDRMTRSAEDLNKSDSSGDEQTDGGVREKVHQKSVRPKSAGNRLNPNFERGGASRTTSKHLGRYSRSSTSLHTAGIMEAPVLSPEKQKALHEVAFRGINALEGKLIHVGDYTPQDVLSKFMPAFKIPAVQVMEQHFKEFEALKSAWKDFKQDAKAFMERGSVLPHEKGLRDKSQKYLKEQEKHSKDSKLQTHLHDFVVDHKKLLRTPGVNTLARPIVKQVNKSLAKTLETGRDRMSEASDKRDEFYSEFREQAVQSKRFEISCNKLMKTLKTFGMEDLTEFKGERTDQSACNSLNSLNTTIKIWASQLANYRDGIKAREEK